MGSTRLGHGLERGQQQGRARSGRGLGSRGRGETAQRGGGRKERGGEGADAWGHAVRGSGRRARAAPRAGLSQWVLLGWAACWAASGVRNDARPTGRDQAAGERGAGRAGWAGAVGREAGPRVVFWAGRRKEKEAGLGRHGVLG